MKLESGSDKILKLMDRKYTLKNYDEVVKKIIDKGKYLSTIPSWQLVQIPTKLKHKHTNYLKKL